VRVGIFILFLVAGIVLVPCPIFRAQSSLVHSALAGSSDSPLSHREVVETVTALAGSSHSPLSHREVVETVTATEARYEFMPAAILALALALAFGR